MKDKILILLQIFALITKSSQEINLQIIKSRSEYFSLIKDNNIIVSLLISKKENLEEIKNFLKNEILDFKEMKFMVVFYEEFPWLKKNLKLEDKDYLYIFVNRKKTEFEDFNDLLKTRKNIKLMKFLENKINTKNENLKEIKELLNLERMMEKKGGNFILYLGKENKNFTNYKKLSLNEKTKFYFNLDKNQKKVFFLNHNIKEKSLNNDIMIIFKNGSINKKSIYYFENPEFTKLSEFLYFKKNSKLRNCKEIQEIIKSFYSFGFPILLYSQKGNSQKKEKEYLKALNFLPKNIIFLKCDFLNEKMNLLQNLVFKNLKVIEEDNLYLVFLDAKKKINVRKFEKSFNFGNIINFVLPEEIEINKKEFKVEEI